MTDALVQEVSLPAQIAFIEGELQRQEALGPRLTFAARLNVAHLESELRCLRAVLATLRDVHAAEDAGRHPGQQPAPLTRTETLLRMHELDVERLRGRPAIAPQARIVIEQGPAALVRRFGVVAQGAEGSAR